MAIVGSITINCPPMRVVNTGWGPRSDREAQKLECSGIAAVDGKQIRVFPIFPKCRVRFVRRNEWEVAPVTARDTFGAIVLDYPAEPVVRQGRLMVAQPIPNNVERSWLYVAGVRYFLRVPLPEAAADPGLLFGLFSYTVRSVVIAGDVLDSLE